MAVDRFEFGCLVFALSAEFSRLQRRMSEKVGLYAGQPRVLTMLRQCEGCALKELSRVCNIGMPSLSVSVRNMEKAGWVYREGSPRSPRIYLTDAGREKADQFHTLIDTFFADYLASLAPEEAERVNEQLTGFRDFMSRRCEDL